MSFLIDTCVLSEPTKPKPDDVVIKWLTDTPDEAQFVSVLTLGEVKYGILSALPGQKRRRLEEWFVGLRPSLGRRVLAFDEACSMKWAELRAQNRGAAATDVQIAATALVHGLTVVTRNVKDFAFEGLSVFNPWRN